MFTALISFFSGTFVRMLFGEIAAWWTKLQDHKQEMEMMRLQAELEKDKFERQQLAIKTQADMGIKVIEAKSEAAVQEIEAQGWLEAVKLTGIKTGVLFIDAWNAAIRPGAATWSIAMITLNEFRIIVMSEIAMSICSAALGIYLADRNLMKRGK
jgi:hypothetical protein